MTSIYKSRYEGEQKVAGSSLGFFSDSGGVLVVDNWRWNIRDMAFWMRRWLAGWGPKDDRLALEIQTRID